MKPFALQTPSPNLLMTAFEENGGKMTVRKSRLALVAIVAVCMALPVAAVGALAEDQRSWTVLMYFGADNDLYQATEFGFDQTLKALAEAKADPAELAVVVLIDGPSNGDTKVFELTKDGAAEKTVEAFGPGNVEQSMTNPATLTEFICWAMPAYPAEKTMLVLKNGHAWCGICPDVTDNADEKILMPIDDVRSAIETVYLDAPDLWIDAIVFDGDNMGSIEVAYELRKVTDYFVGSQQQVPLEGLPYYLFTKHLAESPSMGVEGACIQMTKDYVTYYNNTQGNKQVYDKLLANSQMYVTAAVFRMGEAGEKLEGVVSCFNNYVNYLLSGALPAEVIDEAEDAGIDVEKKLDQWLYPDPTTGELVWAWIPLSRNNISSARDCSLIGKVNDQQGFEWLPDVYTWLWSMSALSNYDAYGDPVPPSDDIPADEIPPLEELKDPFVRLLLEDFMEAFGYEEPGIYRGVWDAEYLTGEGALVWVSQSQILDRSGNSFPHGLNIWFPPSWLQWDEDDAWSDLFNKPMTYAYYGIGVWLGTGEVILMPAEYYCIDCPWSYEEIGLDFTSETVWMDFFGVYYDSRWLIYGPGSDTGGRVDSKP